MDGGVGSSLFPLHRCKTVHLVRHTQGIHNEKGENDYNAYMSSEIFDAHLTCLGWDQVLTVSFLKDLYDILVKLSPNGSLQQDGLVSTIHWFNEADITDLSTLLFEEFHKQFNNLLNRSSYLPHVVVMDEKRCVSSDDSFSSEGFIQLLRCCMIVLRMIEFDMSLVSERCQILVPLVGNLCPPYLPVHCPNGSQKLADIFSNVLEAFVDEFLLHHELRKLFTKVDCVFSTSKRLFASPSGCDDHVQPIMELVSGHFLLSVRDELSINRFIHKLYWSSEEDCGVSALGLDSTLALLGMPVILSAPHFLHAHLIVLASTCIGINLPTDDNILDERVINLYVLAFELSIELYSGLVPVLRFTDNTIGDMRESGSAANGLSFYSCIRSLTCEKLKHQIGRVVSFFRLNSHVLDSLSEAETLDNCIAYIKGNQHFIDEEFREEACSILNYLVKEILQWENKLSHEDGDGIQEEIWCLAAVLRLMSSSLLQIVWLLRRNGYSGRPKISNSICKEYDFVSGIISRFMNYGGGSQHIPMNLFSAVETTQRSKDIKLMFSHLASLLSYSLGKRIDFLWKGCIFMMITLINLLIFEEGNLDTFQPVVFAKEATFPCNSREKMLKGSFHNQSSIVIASNLKKARELILLNLQHEDSRTINPNESSNLTPPHMTLGSLGCNSRIASPSLQSQGPKRPICFCGLQTRVKHSESKQNPEKPYFSCPRYSSGCHFFLRADEYAEVVDVSNGILQDKLVEHVEYLYEELAHQRAGKEYELSHHGRRLNGLIIGVVVGFILFLVVNALVKSM